MLLIPVGDRFAQIDDEDYELLAGRIWYVHNRSQKDKNYTRYAVCYQQVDGKSHTVLMHRLILGASKGQKVDHRNGDGLDNRRANIRLATAEQNAFNSKTRSHSKTGVRNVKLETNKKTGAKRFRAYVRANGITHRSKRFKSIQDAALWADKKRSVLHGEFAYSDAHRGG